jgi:hypothetical protein
MDQHREQERLTYSLCRLGFGLLAVAFSVLCLVTLVDMPSLLFPRPMFPALQQSALWRWLDVPIVLGSLIGAYLLWGRWDHASWQRRAGLFLMMCVADLVLWLVDRGGSLGMRLDGVGHAWLRHNLAQAMAWAEFALMASLSCDVLVHLGVDRASDTSRATRSLAATGAVLLMLFFLLQTDWEAGWPLEHSPRLTKQTLLLRIGGGMIYAITLIQVTALTIAAARQCSIVVAEMDRQNQDHDLLRLPSEEFADPLLDFNPSAKRT